MKEFINSVAKPLIFAPMATVSHPGFRALMEDWGGCDLYFSEMIDAPSLLNGGVFEPYYFDSRPVPEKLIFQIVGSQEETLVKGAQFLAQRDCRGIDVNMGCSAPHIFRRGGGIAWMKDLDAAKLLISKIRGAIGEKTLSIKFRIGETEDEEALVRWASALAEEGLDFLTLHPRLRKESLSRPSRWSYVAALKKNLHIPVYGNGDLVTFEDLVKKDAQTGADGFMVGRRAVAAPWIFKLWKDKLKDSQATLTVDYRHVTARFHETLEAYQPKEFWPTRAQRFYLYFGKNFLFGHKLVARIYNTKDYREIRRIMDEYLNNHPEEVVKVQTS